LAYYSQHQHLHTPIYNTVQRSPWASWSSSVSVASRLLHIKISVSGNSCFLHLLWMDWISIQNKLRSVRRRQSCSHAACGSYGSDDI
jgi:hypothetical protein